METKTYWDESSNLKRARTCIQALIPEYSKHDVIDMSEWYMADTPLRQLRRLMALLSLQDSRESTPLTTSSILSLQRRSQVKPRPPPNILALRPPTMPLLALRANSITWKPNGLEGNWNQGVPDFGPPTDGYKRFVFPDGKGVYDGNWRGCKRHGQGSFTFANGDVYEGESRDRGNRVVSKYCCKQIITMPPLGFDQEHFCGPWLATNLPTSAILPVY